MPLAQSNTIPSGKSPVAGGPRQHSAKCIFSWKACLRRPILVRLLPASRQRGATHCIKRDGLAAHSHASISHHHRRYTTSSKGSKAGRAGAGLAEREVEVAQADVAEEKVAMPDHWLTHLKQLRGPAKLQMQRCVFHHMVWHTLVRHLVWDWTLFSMGMNVGAELCPSHGVTCLQRLCSGPKGEEVLSCCAHMQREVCCNCDYTTFSPLPHRRLA
jgi:hypothetical protein